MNNFDQEFAKLNSSQKLAVETIYGPLIVIAIPGSGKTQILSMRIGQILKLTDTLPSSILCLSFTDAAASNMRKRLHSLIGSQANQVAFHTFHSFGSEIINQNPEQFFFGVNYVPVDNIGQYQILRNIFENLDFNNPLSKYSQDHDYIYLNESLDSIQRLKQGGISEVDLAEIVAINNSFLAEINNIIPEDFNIANKKALAAWPEFYSNFESVALNHIQKNDRNKAENASYKWSKIYQSLAETMLLEVQQVNTEIVETEITGPFTAWKNKNLERNKFNKYVFKESVKIGKQEALIEVYTKYQQQMHKQGFYDFADMLMQVVNKFEDTENPELAFNLQEKYQFILVDEFQDTNGVQLRLLLNLLNSSIPDFQPNILVVGDDDQAIYKFQGANIQNLYKFKQTFPESKEIMLSLNYRSTQDILNVASKVITLAGQRFNLELGIEKELISGLK